MKYALITLLFLFLNSIILAGDNDSLNAQRVYKAEKGKDTKSHNCYRVNSLSMTFGDKKLSIYISGMAKGTLFISINTNCPVNPCVEDTEYAEFIFMNGAKFFYKIQNIIAKGIILKQ